MLVAHQCTGFPQTFDNWIQGLFKDFQGQQQSSRIYFKAQPPLPPLLAVRFFHKILYCHMILTFYKLITTCFAESVIAIKLDDADAKVGQ